MADDVKSTPTYFGREHEAVRHVRSEQPDDSVDGATTDADDDDDGADDAEGTTVVTTLGIVLTIPKEL